jgi:glucose/arabinose dehydrogenase
VGRGCCIAALAGLLSLLPATGAGAANLQLLGTFEKPIYVTSAPDHPNRLFVVERKGEIKEVKKGGSSTFANLSTKVSCCAGEQGLLSIALAPDFATSRRLYVDYTGEGGEIHVAELQEGGGGTAPLSSLRDVLTIPHPGAANHNGGQLQFGPEGDLFISTGDGGGSDDQFHNSQDLESLLGKILRIDPLESGGHPYTIPPGKPFSAPDREEIWAYGLRNPFRFSFDSGTGDLLIADVGQSAREEVDQAKASEELGPGANYGWNCREGRIAGPATDPECAGKPLSEFTEPIFDYPHEDEGGAFGCAIIGGYVVRDPSLGDLYGRYLYGDLCVGQLRSLDLTASPPDRDDRSEGLEVANLNSFGEDAAGRIYVVSGNGQVYCLQGEGGGECLESEPEPQPKPKPQPEPEPESEPEPQSEPAASPSQVSLAPQGLPRVRQTTRKATPRVRARAALRRVRRGRRAQIVVRVRPCTTGNRRRRVLLYRGGRRFAAQRLDRRCRTRFRPRIRHRSTFRVVLPQPLGTPNVKSERLVIRVRDGG